MLADHAKAMQRVCFGAEPSEADLLISAAGQIEGRTICAFGDAAAWPVQSFLKHYREEFEYHITHKCCMVGEVATSKGEAA